VDRVLAQLLQIQDDRAREAFASNDANGSAMSLAVNVSVKTRLTA
jgi:hypothetical protein